jgi:hypothetical protein
MLLMKGAAKWSLTSNIQQHKRVAEIVKMRRLTESGVLKKSLMKQSPKRRNKAVNDLILWISRIPCAKRWIYH